MTQDRIGRYNVLGEIASGGQGAVFRAFEPEAGRLVAIKILHASLTGDRSYLERFRREASITASIVHPNVVRIYEVGESEGRHFMALEFLPENLASLIQAGGLPPGRAATLAAQIADGLGAAHTRGVVHRDMKPQNVLVTPEGTPKVTDFGIARGEALGTMTATGMMMGTPYYMSPEQCLGERATPRSDIYSLGCVLYQMLTGELPFRAETPLAILRQHTDAQPQPVRLLRSDIPLPLAAVVERAMEKDPERRFADGDDMAAALRAAVPAIGVALEALPEEARAAPLSVTAPPPPPPPPPARPAAGPPPPSAPPLAPPPRGPVFVGAEEPPERPRRSRWWIGVLVIIAVVAVVAWVSIQFGGEEGGLGGSRTPVALVVSTPRPAATVRPPTATPPPPTATPRPRPTATPKPAPTATPKPAPTATPKPRPTPTSTPRRPIVTPEPRPLPTRTPTPTPTPTPTATPTPAPIEKWATYGSPDNGFEVSIPAAWSVLSDEETAALVGPTGFFAALDEEEGARSGFTPNVNMLFEVLSDPISLDEYVEQAVDGLLSAFDGFVGIGHNRTKLQDGEAGVVNYDAGGLAGTQYLLLKDGVGFIITCTASLEQADRYAPVFEQIAGSFKLFLPEAPTPTPTPASGPEEIDLGTVAYYEAPMTWTVDLPGDFTRVEVGTYGEGSDVVNKYGGWNAWMNINDNRAWEVLTFNPELGGIIHDYVLGQEVLETDGKGQYLDATAAFRAGTNTITYYHFTDGAIGVKVRIWRAGTATPTPTPRPTATPTPRPTATPTPRPAATPTPRPTATPRPLPDLAPYRPSGWSAPLVHHGAPVAGEPLSIDFAVRNNGSVYASGQFPVEILLDGLPVFAVILPELQWETDYRKTGAEIALAGPGWHRVELIVDQTDDVREEHEGNNSYSIDIFWGDSAFGVTRMDWLDAAGSEITEADRGTTVTLRAEAPGILDRTLLVGVYEVDPLDADDLVEWVEMEFVGGVGRAIWTAVWMEDGFLGGGGNPEYKFVVLGADSLELEVQ